MQSLVKLEAFSQDLHNGGICKMVTFLGPGDNPGTQSYICDWTGLFGTLLLNLNGEGSRKNGLNVGHHHKILAGKPRQAGYLLKQLNSRD